jgi:hypothetical protein
MCERDLEGKLALRSFLRDVTRSRIEASFSCTHIAENWPLSRGSREPRDNF